MASLHTIRFPTVDEIDNEESSIRSEIRGYDSGVQGDLSDVESMDSDNEDDDPTYDENEESEPVQIHRGYDVGDYDRRVASNVFKFLGGVDGGSGVAPCQACSENKCKGKRNVGKPECKKKKKAKKGQETFVYMDLELF